MMMESESGRRKDQQRSYTACAAGTRFKLLSRRKRQEGTSGSSNTQTRLMKYNHEPRLLRVAERLHSTATTMAFCRLYIFLYQRSREVRTLRRICQHQPENAKRPEREQRGSYQCSRLRLPLSHRGQASCYEKKSTEWCHRCACSSPHQQAVAHPHHRKLTCFKRPGFAQSRRACAYSHRSMLPAFGEHFLGRCHPDGHASRRAMVQTSARHALAAFSAILNDFSRQAQRSHPGFHSNMLECRRDHSASLKGRRKGGSTSGSVD